MYVYANASKFDMNKIVVHTVANLCEIYTDLAIYKIYFNKFITACCRKYDVFAFYNGGFIFCGLKLVYTASFTKTYHKLWVKIN